MDKIERLVVIDFETTGLQVEKDEVLQVAIIDENYNTLICEYCKPLKCDVWWEAMGINGITPAMVEREFPFEKYVPVVQDILNQASVVVAYNISFEDGFLQSYGIKVNPEKWFDPMLAFSEIYGEWSDYYGDYKWQSLSRCAEYYGYKFKAHNSLEDAKATLYCYKKMKEQAVAL